MMTNSQTSLLVPGFVTFGKANGVDGGVAEFCEGPPEGGGSVLTSNRPGSAGLPIDKSRTAPHTGHSTLWPAQSSGPLSCRPQEQRMLTDIGESSHAQTGGPAGRHG